MTNLENYLSCAEKEFKDREKDIEYTRTFLSNKKFKLGQVVYVSGYSPIEVLLNVESDNYGIIIGHGLAEGHEGDYYRVHFNEKNSFVGNDESKIRSLEDGEEIPEKLKSYTFNKRIGSYSCPVKTIETFK